MLNKGLNTSLNLSDLKTPSNIENFLILIYVYLNCPQLNHLLVHDNHEKYSQYICINLSINNYN